MRNHGGPPTLCGTTPFPVSSYVKGRKKILPLAYTPKNPYPSVVVEKNKNKNEPPQFVLLLLLQTRAEVSRVCMSTNAVLIGMGTLDDKELFVIEGSEKWALN